MATLNAETVERFRQLLDNEKSSLEENYYFLSQEDTTYSTLYQEASTYQEGTTVEAYLVSYQSAYEYLLENSVYDETAALEQQKAKLKGYLETGMKGTDYDFTDTQAYKEFLARIDACKTMEELEKIMQSQDVLKEIMSACILEKPADGVNFIKLYYDSMEDGSEVKTKIKTLLDSYNETGNKETLQQICDLMFDM